MSFKEDYQADLMRYGGTIQDRSLRFGDSECADFKKRFETVFDRLGYLLLT